MELESISLLFETLGSFPLRNQKLSQWEDCLKSLEKFVGIIELNLVRLVFFVQLTIHFVNEMSQ